MRKGASQAVRSATRRSGSGDCRFAAWGHVFVMSVGSVQRYEGRKRWVGDPGIGPVFLVVSTEVAGMTLFFVGFVYIEICRVVGCVALVVVVVLRLAYR